MPRRAVSRFPRCAESASERFALARLTYAGEFPGEGVSHGLRVGWVHLSRRGGELADGGGAARGEPEPIVSAVPVPVPVRVCGLWRGGRRGLLWCRCFGRFSPSSPRRPVDSVPSKAASAVSPRTGGLIVQGDQPREVMGTVSVPNRPAESAYPKGEPRWRGSSAASGLSAVRSVPAGTDTSSDTDNRTNTPVSPRKTRRTWPCRRASRRPHKEDGDVLDHQGHARAQRRDAGTPAAVRRQVRPHILTPFPTGRGVAPYFPARAEGNPAPCS